MKVGLSLLLLVSLAIAIFVEDEGDGYSGGGGRGGGKFSSSSASWGSSEKHGGHGHGHHGNHGGHGGNMPRPTRRPSIECDAGWMRFERDNGVVWCIYLGTNGAFSQPQAQSACVAMGATLTGYQNENERMTVAKEALVRVTACGGLVAGLWLGATNTPGCKYPSCGPYNTFQWTDGYTTGIGGFKWGIGEPDNINWPGPRDVAQWKEAFVNGDLDKYTCDLPVISVTRYYACGKVGVRR